MLVHIENLVKRYGDLLALDHLSLDIDAMQQTLDLARTKRFR